MGPARRRHADTALWRIQRIGTRNFFYPADRLLDKHLRAPKHNRGRVHGGSVRSRPRHASHLPRSILCNGYIRYVATSPSTLSHEALESLRKAVRRELLARAGKSHVCGWCQSEFMGRADARYCSSRCRTAVHRQRRKERQR